MPNRAGPRQATDRRQMTSIAVFWRHWLARHPRWYWATVAVLVLTSWWAARANSARLEQARTAWGSTITTWCADRAIAPGDTLTDALSRCEIPTAIAPPAAVTSDEGVATQHIDAGSVVTAADVAPSVGPLSLVPDGWVAVTVVESVASGASAGELVILASDGVVITDQAIIVDDSGQTVLIAVPRSVAATVAAAADGGVSVIRAAPAQPDGAA